MVPLSYTLHADYFIICRTLDACLNVFNVKVILLYILKSMNESALTRKIEKLIEYG